MEQLPWEPRHVLSTEEHGACNSIIQLRHRRHWDCSRCRDPAMARWSLRHVLKLHHSSHLRSCQMRIADWCNCKEKTKETWAMITWQQCITTSISEYKRIWEYYRLRWQWCSSGSYKHQRSQLKDYCASLVNIVTPRWYKRGKNWFDAYT